MILSALSNIDTSLIIIKANRIYWIDSYDIN